MTMLTLFGKLIAHTHVVLFTSNDHQHATFLLALVPLIIGGQRGRHFEVAAPVVRLPPGATDWGGRAIIILS